MIRGLTQGPPVDAPVELRLVGQDIDALRRAGDDLRVRLAQVSTVAMVRTGIAGGSPKLTLEVDEARARLLGLDLGPGRAADGGGAGRASPAARFWKGPRNCRCACVSALACAAISWPSATCRSCRRGRLRWQVRARFPAVPLSTLGALRLEPSESTITRRNGERVNTVQAFLMPGVLPAVALAEAMAVLDESGYAPPQGIRLETGGDSDARNSTVQALIAPLGLIITLSIAVVVMTFNSFRLTLIAFAVAGLSAGLSILALAVFDYPFGINAIIGVIGSIGVSINAALIVLSGLQEDPRASSGDRAAMVDVVAGVRPAHHLDHHHHLWGLSAADHWRRRLLAALRDVGCGRCRVIGDAGLRLHPADVCADTKPADPGQGKQCGAATLHLRARSKAAPSCGRMTPTPTTKGNHDRDDKSRQRPDAPFWQRRLYYMGLRTVSARRFLAGNGIEPGFALLRLLAQPANIHVDEHPLTQRGGLLLRHGNLTSDDEKDPNRQPRPACQKEKQ